MNVTTSKLEAGGSHIIVSVENVEEIHSALLFQPASAGQGSHAGGPRTGKKVCELME